MSKAEILKDEGNAFKGQTLEGIRSQLKKGEKFVDKSFPAQQSSVGELLKNKLEWKRCTDFMKKPVIYSDGISPNDIKQGGLGNCYFLSALSILAENPERVRRIIISNDQDLVERGLFAVKIHLDGIPTEVVVDDLVPCLKGGGPAFSKNQGEELWVMLLEKVYAKCYGSYEIIEGGISGDALADLTGAPYQNFKTKGNSALPKDDLWKNLLSWDKLNYMMAASVPDTPGVDLEKTLGLVEGHAYGLLQAKEEDSVRLVQIRNPWGDSTEWKGDYSDNSPKWTESLKKKIGFEKADDGTFWMCFDDFLKYFDDLVAIFYKDNSVSSSLRFKLPKEPKTNFTLKVNEPTSLRVSFNQVRGAEIIHLRFVVTDQAGKEVGTSGKALSSAEVITSSEMNLSAGVYTVTAIIYSKDVEKLPLALSLTSYGTKPVTFGV